MLEKISKVHIKIQIPFIFSKFELFVSEVFRIIHCPYKVWAFVKMHDCYLNYETRFRKFRNLNKVWIDTGIEIYLFFSIDSSLGALNKSNVVLFYLAAGDGLADVTGPHPLMSRSE